MSKKSFDNKLIFGRSEWVALPEFNIPLIKAKVDTGAKSSSIHAYDIQLKKTKSGNIVHFKVNPIQGNSKLYLACRGELVNRREVTSSNGHKELRYFIRTILHVRDKSWEIELSLSNRDSMRYRMLLGREALSKKVIVDPSVSCNLAKLSPKKIASIYNIKIRKS